MFKSCMCNVYELSPNLDLCQFDLSEFQMIHVHLRRKQSIVICHIDDHYTNI